ncbi:hypothetical protein TNIN_88651 [Trichonephila inaurata madagascariensis]|uniref:Uncharacterized protein n=1 Tax=Trichonephila inaurata madagascariensis TaxID=2747483 RepID=A0A8X7CBQ7_9ARAC|nr:hypothetical protein TNIN_88651 [Trichonephila inaurata madagascariensis]
MQSERHFRIVKKLYASTVEPAWLQSKEVTSRNFSLPTIAASRYDSSIAKLLSDFKEITFKNSFTKEPKHLVSHIVTSGPSVSTKFRRLAPDKLKLAKKEIECMLEQRICRPSNNP